MKPEITDICGESFNNEKANELTANFIVNNHLPLSLIDNNEFFEFTKYLNKDYKSVCRQTLKKRLEERYHRERERGFENYFRDFYPRVSLTADGWTSPVGEPFLGLTRHFVDKEWNLNSIVLDIIPFSHPHTAERIAKGIYQSICEWGLEGKVINLTVDNGPNIVKASKLLSGQITSQFRIPQEHIIPFNLKCTAHTIQRVINHGIENSYFDLEGNSVSVINYINQIR